MKTYVRPCCPPDKIYMLASSSRPNTAMTVCTGCDTPEACITPVDLFSKEPEPMPEPDVNPKELRAVADGKAPLDYLEPAGDLETSYVMQHGAEKYGLRNYTVTPCKIRTYVGAVQRHLLAIRTGEDVDPDSGRSHWAHIRACADVVMGADSAGMLVDDRAAYATALSDRVHVDGDTDAKGLTAEYNRGIDELAEELSDEANRLPRAADCTSCSRVIGEPMCARCDTVIRRSRGIEPSTPGSGLGRSR